MVNQGSGDFSSQDGSLPSCSSTSSERNQSSGSGLGEGCSLLMDDEVRAMLKKVTVNEAVLNRAIQSLGGGEKGLKSLMGYIMIWVKQQKECKSARSNSGEQSSGSPFNFSMLGAEAAAEAEAIVLQHTSDAFQSLNGILQPSATQSPVNLPDTQHQQRFKSRRLMMEDAEVDAGLKVDAGFCPSNFMAVGVPPGDYSMYMPAMAGPAVSPYMPRLNYDSGMQQPVCNMQSMIPSTTSQNSMQPIEQTPAMATKAARRNRMARQRQSMMKQHARATNQANPVSVGFWVWNGAPPAGGTKKTEISHSGAQPAQGTAVNAEQKGRNMDSLTFLLQKELRPSDVGSLGRIILPKKEAEQHMPFLSMRGGVCIQVEDFDSGHIWNLRYRFWPNNKSRMYLLENTGDFVKSHRLVEGDLLIIYRSQQGDYVMRGKKRKTQRLETESVKIQFAHSSARDSNEEHTSPKGNGLPMERLYGGGPPEKFVKEEPPNLDDDPFLKDMMMSMGPSFGSDATSLQPLERFPSLNLDFPLDEIMAVNPKTELE